MKNEFKRIAKLFLFAAAVLSANDRAVAAPRARAGGGTVVGTGGDPLSYFLESVRFALTQSAARWVRSSEAQLRICAYDPPGWAAWSDAQKLDCQNWLAQAGPALLIMNADEARRPALLLRAEALRAPGPDGQDVAVAARTLLGEEGPIEFYRAEVADHSPAQLFYLLAHEYGHKLRFKGAFVNDYDRVANFAHGKDLLDGVAQRLVRYAAREGILGVEFGVRDSFACEVRSGLVQMGMRVSSPRLFLGGVEGGDRARTDGAYETSLGRNPADAQVYLPQADGSRLSFQLLVHEPGGCRQDNAPARFTRTSLWREFPLEPARAPERVAETYEIGYSPFCETNEGYEPGFALRMAWGEQSFTCRYDGTEGTTSSFRKSLKESGPSPK